MVLPKSKIVVKCIEILPKKMTMKPLNFVSEILILYQL